MAFKLVKRTAFRKGDLVQQDGKSFVYERMQGKDFAICFEEDGSIIALDLEPPITFAPNFNPGMIVEKFNT